MYGTAQDLARSSGRRLFWPMVRDERARSEVLAPELVGGHRALPVFSFREKAELFLRLGVVGHDWRVKETGAGEPFSVLLGPCRSVEQVALDPLAGIGIEPVNRLVSRGSFLASLPEDAPRPRAPGRGPETPGHEPGAG